MKLSHHFKIAPHWNYPDPFMPDDLLDKISFVFTMGNKFNGLYFKLKEPLKDDGIGMDCFQFAFDNDNGLYVHDGDMRFNDFMGECIDDSGADIIGFMKRYIIDNKLEYVLI